MTDRARAPVRQAGIGGFVTGFYDVSSIDGDGNAAEVKSDRAGFAVGVDWNDPGGNIRIGLAGGWGSGDVDVDARASHATLDAWQIGAYGRAGTFAEGFSGRIAGAYGSGDAEVRRSIDFGTLSRDAASKYSLDTFVVEGEARYGLPVGGGAAIGPVVTIDYASVEREAFAEAGAGSLNVIGAGDDEDRFGYGVGGFAAFATPTSLIDLAVLYDHADGDPAATSLSLEGLPSTSYTVLSPQGAGDAVALRASAEFDVGGAWHVGASYRGRYGGSESGSAVFLTVSIR